IASSGLDTTMIMALGDFAVDLRVTSLTIPAFTFRRSSRLIPGFRGRPEVMTMMSEPAVSSYPLVPVTIVSYPYTGPDCMRSSAFPCGIPSTMSTSTTSQKSFSASRCAVLAPTFPAPITVIFFRLIWVLLRSFANGLRHPFRRLPAAAFGPYLFAMTSSANSELGQNEHLEQRLCFLRRHEIRDRQRLDRGVSLPPSQVYSIQREWGCQGKTGGFGRGGPLTSPPLLCVCFLAPRYSFRAASTPPTSTFSATREPPRSIFTFSRIRRRPSSCSNRSTAAIVCSFVTRTGIPNVSARRRIRSFGGIPPVRTRHLVSVSSAACWMSARIPPVTTALRGIRRKTRRALSTSMAPTQKLSIILSRKSPPHSTCAGRAAASAATLTLSITGSTGIAPKNRILAPSR